nr:hypothetical protein [uncultured bacterium]
MRADYSGAEAPFDFASYAALKRRSCTAARKEEEGECFGGHGSFGPEGAQDDMGVKEERIPRG